MVEFWEPWQPQVGRRVRVRISGECAAHWQDLPRRNYLATVQFAGHVPGEDGRTGVVTPCPHRDCPLCDERLLGHPYTVAFDEELEWRGRTWPGAHYAAIELEPLDG